MQTQNITHNALTIYTPEMEVVEVIHSVRFVGMVGGGTAFVQTKEDAPSVATKINFNKELPHILSRLETATPKQIEAFKNAPNLKVFIGSFCVLVGRIFEAKTFNNMSVFKIIHNDKTIKTLIVSKSVFEKISIIHFEESLPEKFKDIEI